MQRRHCPASASGRKASIPRATSTLSITMWLFLSPGTSSQCAKEGNQPRKASGWKSCHMYTLLGFSLPFSFLGHLWQQQLWPVSPLLADTMERRVSKLVDMVKLSFLINYICWQTSLFSYNNKDFAFKVVFFAPRNTFSNPWLKTSITLSWWTFWTFYFYLVSLFNL